MPASIGKRFRIAGKIIWIGRKTSGIVWKIVATSAKIFATKEKTFGTKGRMRETLFMTAAHGTNAKMSGTHGKMSGIPARISGTKERIALIDGKIAGIVKTLPFRQGEISTNRNLSIKIRFAGFHLCLLLLYSQRKRLSFCYNILSFFRILLRVS